MTTIPDPNYEATFEQTSLNTVSRSKERASYDKKQITEIVKDAKICHVSFVHDGLPQCIPMIGAIEETEEGEMFVYFHGTTTVPRICHPVDLTELHLSRLPQGPLYRSPPRARNTHGSHRHDHRRICFSAQCIQPLDELSQRRFTRRFISLR